MAHLVTQVSQDQDPAKQAELARLQAAELAKKRRSPPLLNNNNSHKQKIKKSLNTRVVAGVSSAAAFGNQNNRLSLLVNNQLVLSILLSNLKPHLLTIMWV